MNITYEEQLKKFLGAILEDIEEDEESEPVIKDRYEYTSGYGCPGCSPGCLYCLGMRESDFF